MLVLTQNSDTEKPIVVGVLFIIEQSLTSTILALNTYNGTCTTLILKISETNIGVPCAFYASDRNPRFS